VLVDLRSDTLTRPSEAMRSAMARADVGDDVYGEDPTVNALEADVAALFGHEAALFVPSGTMGNQISVRLLVAPGEELLLENDAHIITYESAAAAVHGGVQTRTLLAPRGLLDPGLVEEQIRPRVFHVVPTAAVAVENTHNRGGGSVYPLGLLEEISAVCRTACVGVHCDGARIWNAHVATGVPLATYGALFDTLSVCLSKGLGTPVGSVVVSSAERIARARELRARMGGAMRQVGVLAAAGRYALAHNIARLADDHRRAQLLATRLSEAAPGCVDPATVETNLVLVDVAAVGRDPAAVEAAAKARGVLVGDASRRTIRAVTHLDVDDAQIDYAATVLAEIVAG
jgi:threonine aldolase